MINYILVTFRILQHFKYLKRVILESLRLNPPVPLIGKQIMLYKIEQYNIIFKLSNIIVDDQKGITVNTNQTISLYHMFRDPTVFTNPGKFKPERFSSDGMLDKNDHMHLYHLELVQEIVLDRSFQC